MKKKNFILILAGILMVGVVVLGIYLFNFSRQPLNQQLTLIPQPLSTASLTQEGIAPIPTPTATLVMEESEISEEQVCGETGAYTFLLTGSDAEDVRGQPGSDLTRLARVDFSDKKVNIFALPRDLWVDVRSLEFQEPLITDATLGRVYYEAYGRSKQADQPGKMIDGAQASAQMILDNFGVTSNHYIVIDLDKLPTLIDAVGGLPINVPEQMTDPWIGTVIEAGQQILTGEQLASYARAIPDSDFARIQRSDLIIQALRQKILDPSVWVKMPTLYDKFKKMIVTDLSPQQIFNLFCLLREVPSEEIVMEQVKPEWTSPGPSGSLLWDKDQIFSVLKQLDLLP